VIAVRIRPQNLTADQIGRVCDAGCWLPRPDVVASDDPDALELVCYDLIEAGIDVEHIREDEARPVGLTEDQAYMLGSVWLYDELKSRR
jgi:hypothetical protein